MVRQEVQALFRGRPAIRGRPATLLLFRDHRATLQQFRGRRAIRGLAGLRGVLQQFRGRRGLAALPLPMECMPL
jgi:hypothetical protein